MNYFKPIYTEKADCQDCYKCVRMCPVKSIKVDKGSAAVIYETCVLCGTCVNICPVKAKKVRNDLEKAKSIIKFNQKTIAAIAPSWVSDFNNIEQKNLITALKALGFWGVSETALGAQEVSIHAAEMVRENHQKVYLSTACPSIVEYVVKYFPQLTENLTPLYSPLLAQAKLLKDAYGEDVGVVFIGPCVAKKKEADDHKELIDAVLSFEDLRKWFDEEKVSPTDIAADGDAIPLNPNEGLLYPIEGGMIEGIKYVLGNQIENTVFMSFSGIDNVTKALTGLENFKPDKNIFIELLACESGCINGPLTQKNDSTVFKRYQILSHSKKAGFSKNPNVQIDITKQYKADPVPTNDYTIEEINAILTDIGKHEPKDELNCAGCGYNTCREFARSILDKKSEKIMCVTYMRQLAQKKANALMQTMPSGLVIVDDKLKIIECNEKWVKLIGEEAEMMYEVKPGLEDASLKKMVPFYKLFQNVLDTGVEIIGKELDYKGTILLFSIFNIEKHKCVGGIFRDITEPWVGKEQIIQKAKQVIKKNLSTVQKIAFLLGENASETEITLNGIIESFSSDKIDEDAN